MLQTGSLVLVLLPPGARILGSYLTFQNLNPFVCKTEVIIIPNLAELSGVDELKGIFCTQ